MTGPTVSGPVLLERDGAIATITLNRPEVLNALSPEMAQALCEAVWAVDADAGVRCLVIRGAGRGFMAGGDVAGFHAHLDDIAGHAGRLIDVYHLAVRALTRLEKPVLASLHGAVAGAGLSLALTADLAIAADDTVFTLAYSGIGTSPDGGSTFLLPRIVGRRRAMELALLSDRIDAARAETLGLVNRTVPAAQLAAETAAWAARLAEGATVAHGRAKWLIDRSFEHDLDAQLDAERAAFVHCTATADFREGVTAFVEKRRPAFRGR
jgi:2-(1,2-epoxy-1,2-dihydrophenyl)acetyl-CoA isomerase